MRTVLDSLAKTRSLLESMVACLRAARPALSGGYRVAVVPGISLLLIGGLWAAESGLSRDARSMPSTAVVSEPSSPQVSEAEAPTQAAAPPPASQATPAGSTKAVPTVPKWPNYLSTSGNKIVDAEGTEVYLSGVNWFGLETGTFSPHGLWARNWQEMLDQITAAGYNTVRLPYSNRILDPNAKPMEGIDYQMNADLNGLTGLQIMDKIVVGAGKRGLKVLLDRHRPDTETQSKLWYTDQVPEEQWIADWQTLAKRYLGNDTVIGADLHNEPAGEATWGTGDPRTDWRAAAERAGNAILAVNPHWLIVVEGVEKNDNDWYWMGGDLQKAAAYPVRLNVPNKVVYSAHDYGPGVYEQGWFKDPRFPTNLPELWDKHWGYLVKQNIAPVLLGEFGGKSVNQKDREGVWQRALLRYLWDDKIGFTYWAFNPNSVDTGGILKDDWQSIDSAKQEMLASYLSPRLAVRFPEALDQSAVAAGPRKNQLPPLPVKVRFATEKSEERSKELSLKLTVVNETAAHVPLERVEVRYWLSARNVDGPGWASATQDTVWRNGRTVNDRGLVRVERATTDGVYVQLVPVGANNAVPYLRITFDKDSGTMARWGTVDVQLRVTRPDEGVFVQTEDFSFKASGNPTDNDGVGLYFWGSRIWGREPPAVAGGDPRAGG